MAVKPEKSKIFLCYAQEDRDAVQDLYISLREAGFSPWMDKPPAEFRFEGIEPGEVWDEVIRERIRVSDFFLACLSRCSVEKKGYVQREYKLALDRMAEMPDRGVFLIPVLLEPCEPPRHRVDTENFASYQWLRLYEDGVEYLIGTLKRREQRLRQVGQPLDPLLVTSSAELNETVERHKRVLEEGNILEVELHDVVTDLDEEIKGLAAKARAGKLDRNRLVEEFSRLLGGFAGQLSPLVDDLDRARQAKAKSFVETVAIMSDSEAADKRFLEAQIKLHRRTGRTATVLHEAVARSQSILQSAKIRDSRSFNQARRQVVLVLQRLMENLKKEQSAVVDQMEELGRLEQLLPE